MCNPAAFAVISIILTLAGTAVSIQQQQQQAKNAKKASRYNATVLRQQADSVIDAAKVAADAHRRKVRFNLGQLQSKLSTQGVALSEGNALDLQVQLVEFGALDVATEFHNAVLKANALRNSATIEIFKGDAAVAAATGASIATGIGGLAGAVNTGIGAQKAGVFEGFGPAPTTSGSAGIGVDFSIAQTIPGASGRFAP